MPSPSVITDRRTGPVTGRFAERFTAGEHAQPGASHWPAAAHWPVASLAEYHRDRDCESHSSLETLLNDPWRYYQERVLGKLSPRRSSQALDAGTALHALALQPDRLCDLVAVMPPGVGYRTKQADTIRASCTAELVAICAEDWERVQDMAEALRACPPARDLIFEQPGRAEHAIRFAHESGIRLKASFDRLLDDGAIVDLKTARDPSRLGFRRALAEYGYHRQAAIYCQGRDQYVGPRDWPSHYFVVVGNEPPHECAVYIVGQRSLEHGAQQIADLLQRLRDLRDYGVPEAWHGAGHAEPCEIDLPEWEFSREV